MRKFTREITALLASAAIGATAGMGAFSASSEEIVTTAGVDMNPDEIICTTKPTEPTLPPLEGVPLLPDEWIELPTEEMPPLAGDPLPPDEWIETTEDELPPLMGDIAPPDGDVNGDGSFNIADVVAFQKWLLNAPDAELYNWTAADLYADGKLDVFDLTLMRKALIDSERYRSMTNAEEDDPWTS